jgi:hypothetical protein
MFGRAKHWRIPALLGLLAGLVVLGLALATRDTVLRVQVAVSDFVFLAASGPRLGRLPASDQIVLVLYDDASRREMGVLPTYSDDLALYQRRTIHSAMEVCPGCCFPAIPHRFYP